MPERIRMKRVYEPPERDDGRRILVERLWPRGIRRDQGVIDLWLKEIAPSPELRRWYAHDVSKWDEFRRRYEAELDARPELVAQLEEMAREGPITLVFATRDERHSSALVLKEYLEARRGSTRG
ncbi:MAG TPA: DUF488 domain-containing protein [Longimicrobiales bacterium]